jgi:hypothetical protein
LLLILLQFSVVVSRLSAENKGLAQKLAIMEWRLRQLEEERRPQAEDGSTNDGDQANC